MKTGNLLLQREIGSDGKNVCRANGRPITVAQLRRVGSELLNIHGQHDGASSFWTRNSTAPIWIASAGRKNRLQPISRSTA